MLLVRATRRKALRTVFLFLGATIGALAAVEWLDDRIEARKDHDYVARIIR